MLALGLPEPALRAEYLQFQTKCCVIDRFETPQAATQGMFYGGISTHNITLVHPSVRGNTMKQESKCRTLCEKK